MNSAWTRWLFALLGAALIVIILGISVHIASEKRLEGRRSTGLDHRAYPVYSQADVTISQLG
ncbi:MAG: hypothetical protein CMK09_05030 [Ponticaulis sp.]|nr:hypothetical protein [Ponticaulis sp.]